MKYFKIILGSIIAIFTTTTFFEMAANEKGAALYGALTGYVIIMGLCIWLIYSAVNKRKVSQKRMNKNTLKKLREAKESGIISEKEYEEKRINIVSNQTTTPKKSKITLKKLKQLRSEGILTQEEYNEKITHLNENRFEENKSISQINKILIIIGKIVAIIVAVIFVIAAIIKILEIGKPTPFEDKEDADLPEKTNYTQKNAKQPYETNKTKFVYIVMDASLPTLKVDEIRAYADPFKDYNYFCDVQWNQQFYVTDVVEIKNYDLDEKYKLIDNARNNLRRQFSSMKINFFNDINRCPDVERREELRESDYAPKIKISKAYIYDSYSKAWENKELKNDIRSGI